MEYGTTLFVLPSSRAIRERLQHEREIDQLLNRFMTMSEFLSRLLIIDNARMIDTDQRNLLLLEASKFDAFSKLQIERNFFSFVQNSHYVFRFLEELSGENVSIESLQRSDTYGDYEEHLQVLGELLSRYEMLIREHNLIDPIIMKKQYRFNGAFLKSFERVRVEAIGYLTAFEWELLSKASQDSCVEIVFDTTPFNSKMQEKFCSLGFNLSPDSRHLLDIGAKRSEVLQALKKSVPHMRCMGFSQRILQIAFVKQQIYEMTNDAIAAQEIAVVVPDEGFAEVLRTFDNKRNFNFAMGRALSQTLFYKQLKAYDAYMDDATRQNTARLKRLGNESFALFTECYGRNFDMQCFKLLIETLLKTEKDTAAIQAVGEVLFHFEKLHSVLTELSFRQGFHLFMERLRTLHLDDVGGGKITVMGLLETRGVAFDGVIIVDFNEGHVPRISEKDLYLNTAIREHSALPSTAQRQDLQKHYYYQLIQGAKRVAISYVHNDEAIPSRFLSQMQIDSNMCDNETAYANIIFNITPQPDIKQASPVQILDFRSMTISATMLKSYLSCKRHFYYKYVAKIAPHQILKDLPQEWEIGTKLHEALHRLYTQKTEFESYEEIRRSLNAVLENSDKSNVLVRYQLKLWREKLNFFCQNEWKRCSNGIKIAACEKALTIQIEDLKITGRIDRIDQTPQGFEVLDYKSGNYVIHSQKQLDDAVDFQLEFYDLLVSTLGEVVSCGYYNLGNGFIESEPFAKEKRGRLLEHLKTLPRGQHVSFERCDDMKLCSYCDYAVMCGRT